MKLLIDTEAQTLTEDDGKEARTVPLYSRQAFEAISDAWVKVGWNEGYSYTFSWFGRPIIQLPEDMVRTQEVVHRVRPDVIVETGVAHGGSAIYYAALFAGMGTDGRVIGIDIDIRPHNREAIEAHALSDRVTLVEGSSTDSAIVARVHEMIRPDDTVLVILDSDHSRDHVAAELEAYHSIVTPGSYIVATDGIMKQLADVPKGKPSWASDNPTDAALEFAKRHPEFVVEQPGWPFNESHLRRNITHWPKAWLRRVT